MFFVWRQEELLEYVQVSESPCCSVFGVECGVQKVQDELLEYVQMSESPCCSVFVVECDVQKVLRNCWNMFR